MNQCGYNDISCVEKQRSKYTPGMSVKCWYNSDYDRVTFSAPSNQRLIGAVVGASIGLFVLIVTLIYLCIKIWKLCPLGRSLPYIKETQYLLEQ
jgi:hypothetical protein